MATAPATASRPNEQATTGDFEFAALREARNYRHAILREFGPHLKGNVLEIGSGIGQITELVAAKPEVKRVLALEPDTGFCTELRRRLPNQPLVRGTAQALQPNGRWNAILTVNVLEHIEHDREELATYRSLLRSERGCLCLFVPARPEIYAPIDGDFGHFRRYTKPELRKKLLDAGFDLLRVDYFNWVGYFAWWLNFCVLRKRHFGVGGVRMFDRVIFPVVHGMEFNFIRPPFGQSLIAVAQAKS